MMRAGVIFVVCTCVYWRDSTVGISILLILCAGDGTHTIFYKLVLVILVFLDLT
jgi:hypothetical protein